MTTHIGHSIWLMITVATFPAKPVKDEDGGKKKKEKKEKAPADTTSSMGKEKDKIDHMVVQWKAFALVFLCLPHFALGLFVTYVGIGFLVMTGDPGTLVLKAM